MQRSDALALDAADPLGQFRDRLLPGDGTVYLDGNSLGAPPARALARAQEIIGDEWARGLVRSWSTWVELPLAVGDRLGATVLDAGPGQVVVCDSTSVNLYKLVVAALLEARALDPQRRTLVTDDDNFPTDRYLLEGIAASFGASVRFVTADPVHGVDPERLEAGLGPDVAAVVLSHVAFRSGALADVAARTEQVRRHGARVVWDLSHSAGSVPVELDRSGADLAVGCTYKHLRAGPGAPAYLYVRRELQDRLRQPLWGWWGQRDQFAMGPRYEPAPGPTGFTVGTPSILGIALVDEAVGLVAEAGIERLRARGIGLTELARLLAEEWLAPFGVAVASPRDPHERGAHLTLAHPDALALCLAAADSGVVADHRAPDRLRLGPDLLGTRFVDVWDGLDTYRRVLTDGAHVPYRDRRPRVT